MTKSTDDISEGIFLLSHLFVFIFSVNIFIIVIMKGACSNTTQEIKLWIFS